MDEAEKWLRIGWRPSRTRSWWPNVGRQNPPAARITWLNDNRTSSWHTVSRSLYRQLISCRIDPSNSSMTLSKKTLKSCRINYYLAYTTKLPIHYYCAACNSTNPAGRTKLILRASTMNWTSARIIEDNNFCFKASEYLQVILQNKSSFSLKVTILSKILKKFNSIF